ncbi:hypothetical protein HJG60_011247 [Phyllostomus discolor]|uniref:Uncharacterized protein n=1 Tax=Phyllostomus discolor TaxID=89673 RepID=A0A833ZWF0_9CHIR|nr:hypothetical protein HJG60_011247 [Phyllostomus discolor]
MRVLSSVANCGRSQKWGCRGLLAWGFKPRCGSHWRENHVVLAECGLQQPLCREDHLAVALQRGPQPMQRERTTWSLAEWRLPQPLCQENHAAVPAWGLPWPCERIVTWLWQSGNLPPPPAAIGERTTWLCQSGDPLSFSRGNHHPVLAEILATQLMVPGTKGGLPAETDYWEELGAA